MKNKMIKAILPALIIWMSGFVIAGAHAPKLNLILNVENTRMAYFEPLFYSIEITADENSHGLLKNPFGRFIPALQYFDEEVNEWIIMDRSNVSYYYRYDPQIRGVAPTSDMIDLSKQKSMKRDLVYLPVIKDDFSGNYYFKGKKQVKIRAVYHTQSGLSDQPVFSNEIEIVLMPQKSSNKKAAKSIQNFDLPHFMYEYPLLQEYFGAYAFEKGHSFEAEAYQIIKDHPKSYYADWARVYLSRLNVEKVDTNQGNKEDNLGKAETLVVESFQNKIPLVNRYLQRLYQTIVEMKWDNGLFQDQQEYFRAIDKIAELL